jgi:hypothetical protein
MPSLPEDHYRAVCRALATESSELRVFLTKIFTNQTEALRIKADAQSSRQELAKLAFSDWVSLIVCWNDTTSSDQWSCNLFILSANLHESRNVFQLKLYFLQLANS